MVDINSWADLYAIRNNSGATYNLVKNLDKNSTGYYNYGANWTPIKQLYHGDFNGNYHTISDLTILQEYGNDSSFIQSVFSTDKSSYIKNLRLFNINYDLGSYSLDRYGGLIGECKGYLIENVKVTGDMKIKHGYGLSCLCGILDATSYYNGQIKNCSTNVDFVGYDDLDEFGGIAGMMFSNTSISNCYVRGKVYNAYTRCGGLVGNQYGGSINQCYAAMELNTKSGYSEVGGLVGKRTGGSSATNSYFDYQIAKTSTSAGGTSRTTAKMKTQGTFSGWNFSNTWRI